MQSDAPLEWKFLVPVSAGMLLRFWAGAYLGPHGNSAQAQAPLLQRGGPYRFSRNPLYLSNILVGAGLVLFAHCLPVWLEVFACLLLIVHHALLVTWEEKTLHMQWGEAYARYARETPRWIGRRGDAPPGNENAAQWEKVRAWQGRNLAYAVLCVLLLWGAARWG